MNWPNFIQAAMAVAGIISFALIVGSGLAIHGGREGLSNATRRILIAVLLFCAVFYPLAGEACEDEFRADIDNECKRIKCVSWEELEAAIAEANVNQGNV